MRAALRRFHAISFNDPVPRVSSKPTPWDGHGSPTATDVILHGDVHPGNILRLSDGTLGLIDWEECRRGPAWMDLDPLGPGNDRGPCRDGIHAAYEARAGWHVEPDHARRMARRARVLMDDKRRSSSFCA